MRKLAQVSALAAMAMAGHVMAADFSYHYVDGALILADAPDTNDGKGLAIAGSFDVPQLYRNATAYAGAKYIDFDGGNLLNLESGLGFHWPIASVVDFNGGVGLELDRIVGNTNLGIGLNAGVRARPFGPQWELDGGLKYVDVGHNSDTNVVIGARYTFQPGMSAGVQLQSGDIDYWTLSVRWEL